MVLLPGFCLGIETFILTIMFNQLHRETKKFIRETTCRQAHLQAHFKHCPTRMPMMKSEEDFIHKLIFSLFIISMLLGPYGSGAANLCESDVRSDESYVLYWNSLTIEQDAPLVLTPGEVHVLTIASKTGFPLNASLEKTLPDGITKTLSPKTTNGDKLTFEVGPFTAPAEYVYEAGVVYRQGYQLRLVISAGNDVSVTYHWSQALATEKNEQLIPGDQKRFVFTPGWGTKRLTQVENSLVMRPVIFMRLHESILLDSDSLKILVNSRVKGRLRSKIKVADKQGQDVYERDITVEGDHSMKIEVANWKAGTYVISLHPFIDNRYWDEGPVIKYHHVPRREDEVIISPLAHWSLRKDKKRVPVTIKDIGGAIRKFADGNYDKSCWRINKSGNLLSTGCRTNQTPIKLDLKLKGHYALFVEPLRECLVQVGDQGLVRPAHSPLVDDPRGTFVVAKDFTGATLNLLPASQGDHGLKAIYLIPVTVRSVNQFYRQVGNPDIPVLGISDWKVYFKPQSRVAEDQIENIIASQKEIGIKDIAWSIGRSVIEYKSQLDDVTIFPAPPPLSASESRNKKIRDNWDRLINEDIYTKTNIVKKIDAYDTALKFASEHQVKLFSWLAMNRHYHGDPDRDLRWALSSSLFYREHPQWHQAYKDGTPLRGNGRMSYYFPEVRNERKDILLEVASRGPDGILIGGCRQVPMLAYNPIMVDEYMKLTGVDPTKIDGSDSVRYTQWIQWRANFFTDLLRELKQGLQPIERDLEKKVPITIRIPSAGIYWNLAQGLDVRTWVQEKLVDRIQLDPLEDRNGKGSHSVIPYRELANAYDTEIFGGVGSSWHLNGGNGFVPGLKRLHSLHNSGLDGIEIYETELMAVASQERWLIPYAGKPKILESFLDNSNLESCFPIRSISAAYGHDNHSFRETYDIMGFGHDSL